MTPTRRGLSVSVVSVACGTAAVTEVLTGEVSVLSSPAGWVTVMTPGWALVLGAAGVVLVIAGVAMATRLRVVGAPRPERGAWACVALGGVMAGAGVGLIRSVAWADGVHAPTGPECVIMLGAVLAIASALTRGALGVVQPPPHPMTVRALRDAGDDD